MNKKQKLNFYEVDDKYHITALYKQVVKYNMPIKERCCNFKLLEDICINYNQITSNIK